MNLINTITINEAKKQDKAVDPLDILTDLKGEDNTQVYESMETSVTTITEIKEKENENKKNENKDTIDNSFIQTIYLKRKILKMKMILLMMKKLVLV